MESAYVNIHTHRPTGRHIEPRAWGIHPWHAALPEADLPFLPGDGVQAVGEIGLDFACDVPRGRQEEVFRRQLQLAAEHRLPVVLHCVRAFPEVMALLREYGIRRAVFHGFIGSWQQAAEAVRHGFFLSFGLRTFRSPKTLDVLSRIPSGHLFLETDDADIDIGEIYRLAAEVRRTSIEELQQVCLTNYERFFQHG